MSVIRLQLTLVFMGDSGVGKTSLRLRLEGQPWDDIVKFIAGEMTQRGKKLTIYSSSIMRDYYINAVRYEILWTIYDLAGQDYAREVIESLLGQGRVAVAVFDVTRRITFENLRDWWIPKYWEKIEEKRRSSKLYKSFHGRKAPLVLVGNKIDLRREDDPDHVKTEEISMLAEQLSEKLGLEVPYIEISAKESDFTYVEKILELAANAYVKWLASIGEKEY